MDINYNFIAKNKLKVIIRTVCADDAQALIDYYYDLESKYEFRVSEKSEVKLTLEKELEFIDKLTTEKGNLGLVATCEGKLVGLLDFHQGRLKRKKHQGGFGMSVHQDFIGQGIGEALLKTLIDWANDNPEIEKVCLGVLSSNPPAIGLYKKLGFIEEGRFYKEIKLPDGTYVDDIRMYLWVGGES